MYSQSIAPLASDTMAFIMALRHISNKLYDQAVQCLDQVSSARVLYQQSAMLLATHILHVAPLQDLSLAKKIVRKGSMLCVPLAMYLRGKDEHDEKEHIRWIRRAAKCGHPAALLDMSRINGYAGFVVSIAESAILNDLQNMELLLALANAYSHLHRNNQAKQTLLLIDAHRNEIIQEHALEVSRLYHSIGETELFVLWYYFAQMLMLKQGDQHSVADAIFCKPKGMKMAVDYMMQCAMAGIAEAQYCIAMLQIQGHVVVQDCKSALDWLHCAAAQGHAASHHYLLKQGGMHTS